MEHIPMIIETFDKVQGSTQLTLAFIAIVSIVLIVKLK